MDNRNIYKFPSAGDMKKVKLAILNSNFSMILKLKVFLVINYPKYHLNILRFYLHRPFISYY